MKRPTKPQSDALGFSRRSLLRNAGGGFGWLALSSLLAESARGETIRARDRGATLSPYAPRITHLPARARRAVWIFLHGGPSHVDLFDPKPELLRHAGKPLPESFGEVMTRRKVARNPLLGPVKPFRRHGESGLELSDFLPELARHADDLAVIRSCHGDSVNHPQSVYQMATGSVLMGKPSLGSWLSYGLGTENQDLPAFVVLPDPRGGLKGGPVAWGSGYLPATHQGTALRPGPHPILDLHPDPRLGPTEERHALDLIRRLNERHLIGRESEAALEARIESYELAFRMQASAPRLIDFSTESRETLERYGVGQKETDEFGTRCLLARRLLESGVRFVQLFSGDTNGWDAHSDVLANHTLWCRRTDGPIAAFLDDLKQRGLFEDTLVICGGEFGRMPMSEQGKGRDHNPWGYSTWLAGAGVRGGTAVGATDDVGLRAAVDPVHVHDLHATILHLLGLDHERLTYFHNGREERLTDVAGSVVTGVLS